MKLSNQLFVSDCDVLIFTYIVIVDFFLNFILDLFHVSPSLYQYQNNNNNKNDRVDFIIYYIFIFFLCYFHNCECMYVLQFSFFSNYFFFSLDFFIHHTKILPLIIILNIKCKFNTNILYLLMYFQPILIQLI